MFKLKTESGFIKPGFVVVFNTSTWERQEDLYIQLGLLELPRQAGLHRETLSKVKKTNHHPLHPTNQS